MGRLGRTRPIQNPKSKIQNRNGFTLLEIIIVITVLSVLTAAAIPMVRNSVKRQREEDLRVALRQIRQAIDRYRDYYDRNPAAIPLELQTTETRQSHCPPTLEVLAEGFFPANVVGTSGAKVRFLRRLPEDPITGGTEWGKRAYKDEANATSWGGGDVFDVFSKSDDMALNGTKYKDW
jgi:general secretion pathway protein G